MASWMMTLLAGQFEFSVVFNFISIIKWFDHLILIKQCCMFTTQTPSVIPETEGRDRTERIGSRRSTGGGAEHKNRTAEYLSSNEDWKTQENEENGI